MIDVNEILQGTAFGDVQSAGNMDVVPLVGEEFPSFADPDFEVYNTRYGHVNVTNVHEDPTIVPTGAGWIVKGMVQDHAVASGCILEGTTSKNLAGYCIEQTQPGLIKKAMEKDMVILPLQVRTSALGGRNSKDYSHLWGPISRLASAIEGSRSHPGNLKDYIDRNKKELDEFVAEFELIDRQVGAVILINDEVVGIERVPTCSYWEKIWEPLIRICYGSYALQHKKPRKRLVLSAENLQDLLTQAETYRQSRHTLLQSFLSKAKKLKFKTARDSKQEPLTLANNVMAGQAFVKNNSVVYASLVKNC